MSYKASIEIIGKKHTGEGKTVREALNAIDYTGFAGFPSVLTIGERSIVLNPKQTMRLFAKQPLTKEIAVKNTAMRFE